MKLINELITKDIPVIAAVSGGADSVAMLLALCELRDSMGLSLSACHVEHGIRGTRSIADQMFVESLCSLHGVPLFVRTVDAVGYASGEGLSLEEAARILRREAYVMAAKELFPGKRIAAALERDLRYIRAEGLPKA